MKRRSLTMRYAALFYVGVLVGAPLVLVFQRALSPGLISVWHSLTASDTASAIRLTLVIAAITLPLNVVFGVGASLLIVRHPSKFTRALDTLIDVPLAISPIIIGLALELAYASNGVFGRALAHLGWQIIFSWPGIALASAAVSLPLVSREMVPLLQEIGDSQEQTAATLGAKPTRIFFTITLRSVAWAVAYGATLTLARIIGEYGAVLIVSGNITNKTQTLTLDIASNFENFATKQGFAGAALLATISIGVLIVLSLAKQRERKNYEYHD
jgi:sulfate transport system permease protein